MSGFSMYLIVFVLSMDSRNITAPQTEVEAEVKAWLSSPFLNYFGQQRFGSTPGMTALVGQAMLKGDWMRAVDIILDPEVPSGWVFFLIYFKPSTYYVL